MASARAAASPATSDCAQVRAHGRRVPPPPAGRRGQQPVAAQRVEQLHRLVRVAGRVRLDHLGQARRRGRGHVQHLRHHGDRAGDRQVVQPQLLHPGLIPPPGQRRRQRMRRVDLAVAVGAHQQQALDRLLASARGRRSRPGCARPTAGHRRTSPPAVSATRPPAAPPPPPAAPAPARSADRPARAAPPAAPRTPAPSRSPAPRSARPRPGSARGPGPARPPARPAAAGPARGTPD